MQFVTALKIAHRSFLSLIELHSLSSEAVPSANMVCLQGLEERIRSVNLSYPNPLQAMASPICRIVFAIKSVGRQLRSDKSLGIIRQSWVLFKLRLRR